MRELKNNYEEVNEFYLDECSKDFTTSLKDLVMMATMTSIIFLGVAIIVAFKLNMGGIKIFEILFILWLICTMVTIIKYYNFKVTREGAIIKLSYGLFYKKEITVLVKQIQSLIIVEGVIKKPLGYFSLKVETMGGEKDKGKSECILICPIAKSKELNKFFEDVLPEMNITYELRNASPKELNGYLLLRVVQEVIIIGLIAMVLPFGYYAFLIVPILLFWNNIRFKDNGMYYGNDFVVMRFRKLDRKTVIIHKECIQSFEKEQNLFQKKKSIAKYKVTIAGNNLGKSYVVGYMSENNHKSYSAR